MKSNKARHQPACALAHEMLNKLSAIIGNCDLRIGESKFRAPKSHATLTGSKEDGEMRGLELREYSSSNELWGGVLPKLGNLGNTVLRDGRPSGVPTRILQEMPFVLEGLNVDAPPTILLLAKKLLQLPTRNRRN